ncbi:MAG: hypothetical protein UU73_C0002G0028 [Candidatus Daviesbacteria bacterium GW2011_GWA1_41_61]|uniref:Ribbon-helix-helix protein CopG domain-containing protein n=1 Tax=Candidatus Daviesbacteria bacterium GW2011_GWA2_40_9 TaxID=1618424 RepID=A0A0G0X7V0_9BACT|nr:MAG: hypothetical protein UU26_C0008G0005 [Candidatus Daviesbacteria bacterium GW2011_GWC1_40_9]KKR83717.1 MAG: hypothetical protein UU29_C0002G0030 [Candidatus Daviesbacteria bacterium GW2011_GWA2_40_9]KKR93688.1 MAG: hypothetical protein UU44_C0001G0028 [Candidatus Daviesbacteria bacterium GW2011_GWB1_41_15]KKS15154.1 MAG: hypothetical protein UU73_C0002G0028 [Candidatus Daviesbacteria bacterium GW2011_GWA1_41_61]
MQATRTQIYLPKELREAIDRDRREKHETLAEYLRKAAEDRLQKEKKEKEGLKKLAAELGNLVTKSGWEGIDVIKWQREIRKDRKIL